MDRRDAAMALSGSSSYYLQRGIPNSTPQSQPTFHGSQGFHHHLTNSTSPFASNPVSNSTGFGGSPPPLPLDPSSAASDPPPPATHNLTAPPQSETSMKRKRGRPRKYGQDGSVSLALSPSISTITPNSNKRGRGRPPGSGKKQRLASIGELMPSLSGMSFTPHVIVVSMGEDIALKVITFSQQGPREICVLSASGAVSTATLLQPSPSQGTITYEGRFELISLSTSYMVTNEENYPNRTGSLSVSLASPDGRVIGGGIGGPLIAASPVQVILGSFIWAMPKVKVKKREEICEDVVQDTTTDQTLDNDHNNTTTSSPPVVVPQTNQNLVSPSVGIWSTGSRSMDMHHAHIDIDLMRG